MKCKPSMTVGVRGFGASEALVEVENLLWKMTVFCHIGAGEAVGRETLVGKSALESNEV